MKKVLIIAAHADDEVLGVGGSINRWVTEGKKVACLFMADGETSRETDSSLIHRRAEQALDASRVLGHEVLGNLSLPDNRLDQVPMLDLAQALEPFIIDYLPDTVLTHSSNDLNIDHRRTLEAVLTACRPQPNSPVKRIASFEVPSATGWLPSLPEFQPNYFIELVEDQWQKKLEALHCYKDEIRPFPHFRSLTSIDALAQFRGSSVGMQRAEALHILRWIEDY